MNVGDADPSKKFTGDVFGVEFNPPITFNYSRRFDQSLKHQLLHYLESLLGPDALRVQP